MAKQRQIRMQQQGAFESIQQLERRSDEQLETETRHKAAAMAILGARAAERYDAKAARAYFQRAITAARPQERMQIRRMADASIALAERRADDLKDAVERLGQAPPSGRQMMLLRFTGLIAPPPGASLLVRLRGIGTLLLIFTLFLGLGFGVVTLAALPFGGIGLLGGLLLGLVVMTAALGVLTLIGRRKQSKARARAASSSPRS